MHAQLTEKGISASIGTASASAGPDGLDLDSLLERADAAMYAAKVARRNRPA